jgi:organic radical activating enzyme
LDPEKPACPVHGIREVAPKAGNPNFGRWFQCSFCDFKKFVSREFYQFGEVISLDIWEKILKGLDNLGQVISQGGDDMQARAKKELYELGEVVAMEKAKSEKK